MSSTIQTSTSVGIMVVGLGGANGTTMLAGILANQLNLTWYGPLGDKRKPSYYGCITQLNQRGVHGGVGYRDRVPLADATRVAMGGWDIRPSRPGDALLDAQILDYDLVRQLREPLNRIPVLHGLYDPRFIGTSQHATATHILEPNTTSAQALDQIRADIRQFKESQKVDGHTTVIWSASVEPNYEYVERLRTAEDVLEAIEQTEEERGKEGCGEGGREAKGNPLPPSLIYAVAALLEGCSFINGGSQNTLSCPGLTALAQNRAGVYCLGTDFKAGQTKFKTAAVEYLRTMGLKPRVIASSNHLGNNDMRNLASAATASNAKLRVKHDIFAPWHEHDLDHKVSIMFTEYINDDKRDFVEYTSLGFLEQPHTMVTYTRASDSVLCVPLMIDGAIWCDFFSKRSWPYDKVAKALAYLFKVPEGGAKGVDPGFFRQMQELEHQVMAAHTSKHDPRLLGPAQIVSVHLASSEWTIPFQAGIICAGLACLDMQLNHATGGHGGENIETFEGEKSIGGGSVSMACKTLAKLCHGDTPMASPVVSLVIPLCKIGSDSSGEKLLSLLEECGVIFRNVETKYIKMAREKEPAARTALSVLPIYQDGRRGCFFDAGSNKDFCDRDLEQLLDSLALCSTLSTNLKYGAFIFGYPHILPKMQGESLAHIFVKAKSIMFEGGITALDLNGVNVVQEAFPKENCLRTLSSLKADATIGPVLEHVDILHLNEEELGLLMGYDLTCQHKEQALRAIVEKAVQLFLSCGVAVVAVTFGARGSYVACGDRARFAKSPALPVTWTNRTCRLPSVALAKNTVINTNGGGDSYLAGLLVASMLWWSGDESITTRSDISAGRLSLESAIHFASLVAAHHIDVNTRDLGQLDIRELLEHTQSLAKGLY